MKKFTVFLVCLLLVVVGSMFVFKYIGVTTPITDNGKVSDSLEISVKDNNDLPTVAGTDGLNGEYTGEALPAYYSCIDNNKISKTRDQGELGSCWAFAVNAALESRLLPDEEWDFSEDHILNNNGFAINAYDGGDYFMALSYLTSWRGPVTEEDDPYNDGITNENAQVVKHLQQAVLLSDEDTDTIKSFVYKYGAVESAIYMAVDDELYIDETYYNKYNYSYCYDGNEDSNHEIVIIGWDDNYPAENFNTGAYTNGAFICMNSWGTEFGDNGMFYVSYCDSKIGVNVEAYTVLAETDNYDNLYQYDDQGWVGRMGFEDERAFFANVYTARNNETLKAAAFYATGKNTEYAVYICRDYYSENNLSLTRELVAKGTIEYAGYYTVNFDKKIEVDAGRDFAVIVEILTPGSEHPVAIEMDSGDGRTNPVITEGKKSYISPNGRSWSNTQEELDSNVCLKAFTDNR